MADLAATDDEMEVEKKSVSKKPKNPKTKSKGGKKSKRRAKSAYNFFCSEMSTIIRAEKPDMKFNERTQECALRWKNLSESEKAPYNEKAAADKKLADAENANFVPGSDDEDGGKKKKKAAQPKAKSAYNYFVKESHQKLKDEKSSLSMSEKTKKIGVDWKAMSSEQKKPYEDLAAADKVDVLGKKRQRQEASDDDADGSPKKKKQKDKKNKKDKKKKKEKKHKKDKKNKKDKKKKKDKNDSGSEAEVKSEPEE